MTTYGPKFPLMAIDEWKRRARTGHASTDVTIRKADVVGWVKATDDDRTVNFTISTGAVDRDMDTIDPAGWDLRAYKKNPVVLWAHDYSGLPIGRATVTQSRDRLTAVAEFPTHPFADTVFQMVKEGFLNATSVGFRPTKFAFNEDRKGVDFLQQELLEFSVVPVPANPEALVEASIKGLDPALVRRCFDELREGEKMSRFSGPVFDIDENLIRTLVEKALDEAFRPQPLHESWDTPASRLQREHRRIVEQYDRRWRQRQAKNDRLLKAQAEYGSQLSTDLKNCPFVPPPGPIT